MYSNTYFPDTMYSMFIPNDLLSCFYLFLTHFLEHNGAILRKNSTRRFIFVYNLRNLNLPGFIATEKQRRLRSARSTNFVVKFITTYRVYNKQVGLNVWRGL
jgi:hypothetical protein